MVAHRALIPLMLALFGVPAAAQQGRRVVETEPNDAMAAANLVQLRDTVNGFITTRNDVDFFQLDLQAGAKLEFAALQRKFCLRFAVYRADGTTLLSATCRDEREQRDTFHFVAPRTERYYVSIADDFDAPGEADHPAVEYLIKLGVYQAPARGLGDPVSVFASGFAAENGGLMFIADAPDGGFFATDLNHPDRIIKIGPQGSVSTFASDAQPSFNGGALDAFGNLLVSSFNGNAVWRYDVTTGARTQFVGAPSGPFAWIGIAIGPGGDVWLGEPGDNAAAGAAISQFDAFGHLKERLSINVGGRVWALAFSPAGDLHFITQSGSIYKLVGKTPQLVIPSRGAEGFGFSNFVFDADGWLYVSERFTGRVLLFDPQYRLVRDPLSQVLDSLRWDTMRMSGPLAFLRDQSGAMTARLMVERSGKGFDPAGPYREELVELNHSGMGAAGYDPILRVDRTALRSGTRSTGYADTLRVLGTAAASEWKVLDGALPPGVTLAANSGVLSGTPSDTGKFDFLVRASTGPRTGFARFTITVAAGGPVVQVSLAEITTALLGGAPLSADAIRYLDNLGNKNGELDVGDLRAFLRSQGQLTGANKP